MAKVHGALFSFGASGTVAKILTINQSDQAQTARKKPAGGHPPSPSQVDYRSRYADASKAWRALTQSEQAGWRTLATARRLPAFAAFTKEWIAQAAAPGLPPQLPVA